jgi:hypothetical protein
MKEREFYCVKCNKKVSEGKQDICVKIYTNKRTSTKTPALVSKCHRCSTNLTKFVKKDNVEKLTKKYGKC